MFCLTVSKDGSIVFELSAGTLLLYGIVGSSFDNSVEMSRFFRLILLDCLAIHKTKIRALETVRDK